MKNKPVLAPWCAVEINNDLYTVSFGPLYCFLQVGQLSLDVRFSRTDLERPVTDWKAYVIQSTEEIGQQRRR